MTLVLLISNSINKPRSNKQKRKNKPQSCLIQARKGGYGRIRYVNSKKSKITQKLKWLPFWEEKPRSCFQETHCGRCLPGT